MIITYDYAKKLVDRGKAVVEGYLKDKDPDIMWGIVMRYDISRVDHYRIKIYRPKAKRKGRKDEKV